MQYNCEIIRDLLPLYLDGVCSTQSQNIIAAHLAQCPACTAELAALRSRTDTQLLAEERDHVLAKHRHRERRRTLLCIILGTCLLVPLLVCFICNLAITHTLDWFFIVLASLGVFAALTLVPLLTPSRKFLWTFCAGMVTLVALLAIVCGYVGGDWFWIASISAVAGLLLCGMPFAVWQIPLPATLRHHRALLTMLVDTLAVCAIIFTAGCYTGAPNYWRIALPITGSCLAAAWLIFLIVRYLPLPTLLRTGLVFCISGLLCGFANDLVALTLGELDGLQLAQADFTRWNATTLNGNIGWICILIGLTHALICLMLHGKRRK